MSGFRTILAGERGRLLVGLLFAEFGTAVQVVAEAAVLPLASRELDGAALYGATVAGPPLSAVVFVVLGPTLAARLGPRATLAWSTVVYMAGVLLAVLAPVMELVLAGRLLQGAAAGLLAAFGLAAVGSLYDDDIRPRVLGLFSVVWLLPSVLGPVVNAVVAELAGWRWAMAWPAVLVVGARVLIGSRAALLPRPDRPRRAPYAAGALVIAGLALASAAPQVLSPPWSGVGWAGGVVVAIAAGAVVLRTFAGRGARLLGLAVFAGLNITYFGSEGLLSLGLIDVAGAGVVGASIAFAGGAIAWSVLGLRPAPPRLRPFAAPIGAVSITAAAVALAATTLSAVEGVPAVAITTTAWAVAGAGMGLAYPVLSAGAFDAVEPERVPALSAAVAFAETGGTAAAALLGSGFYSVTTAALPDAASIGSGHLLIGAIGAIVIGAAIVLARGTRSLAQTSTL